MPTLPLSGFAYGTSAFRTAAHALIIGALLLAGNAFAAPPCWPKPVGTGSYMTTSTATTPHPDGEWAYWFCPDPYKVTYGLAVRHKDARIKLPATDGMTVVQSLEAIWSANVNTSLGDEKLAPITTAAMAHMDAHFPPIPKWVVAKNGTTTTRPVYARKDDGTLGALDKSERVAVGAQCFCHGELLRVVSGTATYCAIRAEEPVKVTRCSKAAP